MQTLGQRQQQVRAGLAATDIFAGINDLYVIVSRYAVPRFDGRVAKYMPLNDGVPIDDVWPVGNELLFLSMYGLVCRIRLFDTYVQTELRTPPISFDWPIAAAATAIVNDEIWSILPGSWTTTINRRNLTTGNVLPAVISPYMRLSHILHVPTTNTIWIWSTARQKMAVLSLSDLPSSKLPELHARTTGQIVGPDSVLFDRLSGSVWTVDLPTVDRYDAVTYKPLPTGDVSFFLAREAAEYRHKWTSMFVYETEIWFCCGGDLSELRFYVFDGRSAVLVRSFGTAELTNADGRTNLVPIFKPRRFYAEVDDFDCIPTGVPIGPAAVRFVACPDRACVFALHIDNTCGLKNFFVLE